jgi:hypothetical protein
MLSITQKEAIRSNVKTSYTVDGQAFTATVQYANQAVTGYPTITLHHAEEDLVSQNTVGLGSGYQRSLDWLSVNVFAKSQSGKNAFTIAHEIAKQLRTDIRQNWKSGALLAAGLKFKRMSPARDLSMLEVGTSIQIARLQFDAYIDYDVYW